MDDRLDRIEDRLREIGREVKATRKRIAEIRKALARIERQGWTDRRIKYHDKAKRYMVLVKHEDGHAKKEYIGADPDKQAMARGQVERFEQRQALHAELARIGARMQSLESRLGFGSFGW